MHSLLQDIRYALRMMAQSPGFTAAAVLCLALGIGATTAIFSVVNAVVFRPLPYADSGSLVRIFSEFPTFPNGGLRRFWISGPEYLELKRDLRSFSAIETWVPAGVNLAGEAEPVRANAAFVSAGMLSMLGVHPLMGRLFQESDDRPGVPRTAVLSYALWQRAYGGERNILHRDVRLNGLPCTIVGIMPDGFQFPPGDGDPLELWTPLQLDPARPGGRGGHSYSVLGRLQPGVGMPRASAEVAQYVDHSRERFGQANHAFDPKNHTLLLAGFHDDVIRQVRPAMLVLFGAVGFVLLIACVNVANLLLARAEARRREIAIRTAIGAGFGRLLRQFVSEGILLSLAGAALGLALAFGGLRLLLRTSAGSIPRAAEIGIDWQVLLFTLAVSIATGIAFGLAPVLHMAANLYDTLKAASGRTTATQSASRFRGILVAGELALTLVLLIGTGLMVQAFWKLQDVNAGIDARNLLTARISLPTSVYPDGKTAPLWSSLLERLNALPGVRSAAIASGLPPDRPINANDTEIEGFVPRPGGPLQNIDFWNRVSAKYFETLGAKLMEGRVFDDRDGETAAPVVMINHTMARTYYGNDSAIGRRVRVGGPKSPWLTIVGVVADIKNAGLDRATGSELYFPYRFGTTRGAAVILKTTGDPMAMTRALRAEVQALDRALPLAGVRSMEDVMALARSRPRFLTVLLTLFSGLSLTLAALGIYGVISYAVAQRTSEIGLRMALGAQTGHVLRLILGQGARLGIAGTAAGAIGAFALTRFLRGLLFGVSEFDPVTFIGMAAVLVAVTLLACYLPARRATRVDPLVALRYE
jgi:predicted permease